MKGDTPDRPSELNSFADKLSYLLRQAASVLPKQNRTVKPLNADWVALGYDGVTAFAREWNAARHRDRQNIAAHS